MNTYVKEITNSRFLGKEYEGFVVTKAFLKNEYRKQYGKDSKPAQHRAYSFLLENKERNIAFTLSDNQLRLIDSGKRTIEQMLTSAKGGCKNPQLCEIKRKVLKKDWDKND